MKGTRVIFVLYVAVPLAVLVYLVVAGCSRW